jgi:hypothetical protein
MLLILDETFQKCYFLSNTMKLWNFIFDKIQPSQHDASILFSMFILNKFSYIAEEYNHIKYCKYNEGEIITKFKQNTY